MYIIFGLILSISFLAKSVPLFLCDSSIIKIIFPSFCVFSKSPPNNNHSLFHYFIIRTAQNSLSALLKQSLPVQKMMSFSYNFLFIDGYQIIFKIIFKIMYKFIPALYCQIIIESNPNKRLISFPLWQ